MESPPCGLAPRRRQDHPLRLVPAWPSARQDWPTVPTTRRFMPRKKRALTTVRRPTARSQRAAPVESSSGGSCSRASRTTPTSASTLSPSGRPCGACGSMTTAGYWGSRRVGAGLRSRRVGAGLPRPLPPSRPVYPPIKKDRQMQRYCGDHQQREPIWEHCLVDRPSDRLAGRPLDPDATQIDRNSKNQRY